MKVQKNTRNKKRFTSKMQANLLLVFCIISICLVGLIIRLVFFKYEEGERYTKKVLSQQTYMSNEIAYKRGDIIDRNNSVLATSEKVYNVIWDIRQMLTDEKYIEPTKKALTDCFELDMKTLNQWIADKPESPYVKILEELTYDQIIPFKELAKENKAIKGVWFEEKYIRKYPFHTVGSEFIGFTSGGEVGIGGLEEYYNEELTGSKGREYGYFDSELNLVRNVKPPVNGNSLVLTIDVNVQRIIEKHIKKFDKKIKNKNTAIIVANPQNGEIYAMASSDPYDLNNPRDLTVLYKKSEIKKMSDDEKMNALNNLWRSFDVHDNYEPGSTFKPFTIAAGLEEGILNGSETYYCDGFEMINGQKVRCNKETGHGQITLKEAMMYSCNDALMQIAKKMGRKRFSKYTELFGFGKKTGIDMLGEASGLIFSTEALNAMELATSSFGQGLMVSMTQMVAGFSSIVNGGHYYEPHLVKQIVSESGAVVDKIGPTLVKEVISRKTSELLKDYMYATVEDGTARGAAIKGYEIGGKTGTAQTLPRDRKKFLVSFIGFTPIADPKVVVYVIVNEPEMEGKADSKYATGLARDVMAEIFPFLGIYPTDDVDPMDPFNEKNKDSSGDENASGEDDNKEQGDTGANDQAEEADLQNDEGSNTDISEEEAVAFESNSTG